MDSVFRNRGATLLMLTPALLVYTVVMLIPIVWSVTYTFQSGNAVTGFEFVGFDNWIAFFGDATAMDALWFTLRYAIVMTTLQVAAGYGLALLYIFFLRNKSSLVRATIFFPVILPTVAVALMFSRMFEAAPTAGPVNTILMWLGGDLTDFLGDPGYSFWVIIIMDVWRSMGFYAVLLYAGLVEIPQDIMESARIDGASGWKLVRKIVFPLSLPILLSSIIFSINGTLKVFDSIVALTNGGPGSATTPLTLYMFRTSFAYGQYGYGSTVAFMLTLLCLIATVFVFRSMRKDVTR
ncbi:carbohydrate ABC transporter permease [Demequina zhanjiangensis]|uniref:Sugar ABC transporter permease n=1 Tax=Demequina zhanjiangensis TaxID=3051659 RepID=A0ABT8FXT5_9MICO|nr:sugar ABC transporter permease [Demequina sp. SYSU T00b26]MDN4471719.1 sugar ABC transporter permease [Demequina sp. SYSU T00b26]